MDHLTRMLRRTSDLAINTDVLRKKNKADAVGLQDQFLDAKTRDAVCTKMDVAIKAVNATRVMWAARAKAVKARSSAKHHAIRVAHEKSLATKVRSPHRKSHLMPYLSRCRHLYYMGACSYTPCLYETREITRIKACDRRLLRLRRRQSIVASCC